MNGAMLSLLLQAAIWQERNCKKAKLVFRICLKSSNAGRNL